MADQKICIIEDCSGKILSRGLCHKHYSKTWRKCVNNPVLEKEYMARGLLLPSKSSSWSPPNVEVQSDIDESSPIALTAYSEADVVSAIRLCIRSGCHKVTIEHGETLGSWTIHSE